MNPIKLKVNGFLSIKNLEFDFPNGVFIIDGFDRERKRYCGSGKSSFINSICMAIYGKMPMDGDYVLDEIINDDSDNMSLEFQWENKGVKYRVIREREKKSKKTSIKLYENGKSINKSKKDIQEDINEAIGFNYQQFLFLVYISQKDKKRFVDLNNTEKKLFLTSILDLEAFDSAFEKVKKDINEFELVYQKQLGVNEALSLSLKETNDALMDIRGKLVLFKSNKENRVNELNSQIKAQEQNKDNVLKEIAILTEEDNKTKSDIKIKIEFLSNEIQTLTETNKKAKFDFDVFSNDKISKIKAIEKIINDLEKSKKTIGLTGLDDIKNNIYDIEQKLNDVKYAKSLYTTKNADLILKQKDRERLLRERDNNTGTCSMCGQTLPNFDLKHHREEYDKAVNNLDKEILDINHNLTMLKEILDLESDLLNKLNENKFNIQNIEKKMALEIDQDIQKHKKGIYDINIILGEERNKLAPQEHLITEKNREVIYLNSALTKVNPKISELRLFIPSIEKNISNIENQISLLDKEEEGYNLRIKDAEIAVNIKEKEIADIKNKILELDDRRKYLLECKKIFSPNGLRSFVFHNIINELNDRIGYYLDIFWDNTIKLKFVIDEGGSFNGVVEYEDRVRNLTLYSGGEKRAISLAVDMALMDVCCNRLNSYPNILFIDEGTDNLDGPAKEVFVTFLNELKQKREKIYVIDHSAEIKSMISSKIRITKNKGNTNLEIVND